MRTQATDTTNLEAAIWNRLIGSDPASLSPDTARFILDLEFPDDDKARLRQLAAKARQGSLTPEEEAAVETYSRVGSILGILKSKARLSLKRAAKSNGKRR
jgi:hypothetical protein